MSKWTLIYLSASTLIWVSILLISCTPVKLVALSELSNCRVVPGVLSAIGWTTKVVDGAQIVLVCDLGDIT